MVEVIGNELQLLPPGGVNERTFAASYTEVKGGSAAAFCVYRNVQPPSITMVWPVM